MSALSLALAVLTGGAAPAPEWWITIDRDVLTAFETGADEAGVASLNGIEDPLRLRSEVVAAPMGEQRINGGTAAHSVPFAQLGAAYMAELAKGGFTARPEKSVN